MGFKKIPGILTSHISSRILFISDKSLLKRNWKDFKEITKLKLSFMNTSISIYTFFLIQPFNLNPIFLSFTLAT